MTTENSTEVEAGEIAAFAKPGCRLCGGAGVFFASRNPKNERALRASGPGPGKQQVEICACATKRWLAADRKRQARLNKFADALGAPATSTTAITNEDDHG